MLGPSTPNGFDPSGTIPKLFSYSFRLRWFRLRWELTNLTALTCWAEGLLRDGGGGGMWAAPPRGTALGPTIGARMESLAPGRSPTGPVPDADPSRVILNPPSAK